MNWNARIRSSVSRMLELWPYVVRALKLVWKGAPGWTAVWIVLLVIGGLLPVASVYLTKYLVNSLVLLVDTGLESATLRPALLAIAAMALVMVASALINSLTGIVLTAQAELIGDNVRDLVQGKAMQVDLAFYDSPEYYDRLYRARYEGAHRPLSLVRSFGSLTQNTITLVAMAGVLLQYGVILPLALFVSSIPALFVVLHNRVIMHDWRMRVTSDERRSWYYDWLLTDRSTAPELRLFDLGEMFRGTYRELRTKLREEQFNITRKQGVSELFAGLFGLLTLGLSMAWMIWQAILGLVTLGDLALFYQAFNTGQSLMRTLLNNVGEIYASSLFLEDLFEFLDLESQISDPPAPLPPPSPVRAGFTFEQVEFRYPNSERALLENFNLSVQPGQFVAIVGKNGAGKSTLVKLLTRLYEVNNGRISVGGADIRQLRQEELRRLITVLFQDPVQYNDTAYQNIAFGDVRNASTEKIHAASHAAGSDEIVERLPAQYETMLGKWFGDGTELSIGEWQRLALARAFLRRAPIVVLDEPTSAMDPWAEAEWLQRLQGYAHDQTVLLITHRFSTAMYADVIHVMDNGRIVESGTHDELLVLNKLYADSWNASGRMRESRGEILKAAAEVHKNE